MPSIKMKTTSAGPAGTRLAGHTYPVSAEEGQALVAGGYATWVNAPEAPEIERAVAPPPESAVAPAGQPSDTRRPRRRR